MGNSKIETIRRFTDEVLWNKRESGEIMPSTFFGLTIASSGLNAANVSINTTAHNVSNIETKGYSRQQTVVTAADGLRVYSKYGMVGSGVSVISVEQMRDSYYDQKYWHNSGIKGEYSAKSYYTAQIEDIYFNEMTDSGFTTYYGNFCNALDSLSATPSEGPIRNKAIQAGQALADYYNDIAENLKDYQDEANMQIQITVDRINGLAQNIASINNQINVLEMNGGYANDLRDKRNVLVDELSELVGVDVKETTSETGSPIYNIKINNQVLVSGKNYNTLKLTARESDEKRHSTDVNGIYDIKWNNGQTFNIYNKDMTGALKGYVEIRDGDNLVNPEYPVNGELVDYKGVPYYMAETNAFLSEYARQFNELQMSGEDLNGDSTEEVPFFTIKNMTVQDIKNAIIAEGTVINPGKNDIIDYISAHITADNICVNPVLLNKHEYLGTASTIKDGVETPDIATQMAELRKKKSFNGFTAEDAMQSLVSVSSIDSAAANSMYTNHTNIGNAIINQRLSICGVDKEEEAVSLLKYQHAYDLASKVISVMNELYDKLINQTGV